MNEFFKHYYEPQKHLKYRLRIIFIRRRHINQLMKTRVQQSAIQVSYA